MRMKVIAGFGPKSGVHVCEGESVVGALRIDRGGDVPIIPIFPELVGQHFCFVSWEQERPYLQGGPGCGLIEGYRGGPTFSRSVWRAIVFGRFFPVPWTDVPIVSWSVTALSYRRVTVELDEMEGGRDLASVFKKSSPWEFNDHSNVLCLGNDSCIDAIEEMTAYRGPIHVEPSVWADIFLAMPDATHLRIPGPVQKAFAERYHGDAEKRSELIRQSEQLLAKHKNTSTEIQALEADMAVLARLGAI